MLAILDHLLSEACMSEQKRAAIRNSTVEFLIFTGQAGENSIEVRIAEESVWLTQKVTARFFVRRVISVIHRRSLPQPQNLKLVTHRKEWMRNF